MTGVQTCALPIFIFIPKFGYVAAAYTTLASYVISFALHSRYAKKLEPDLYPLKQFIIPLSHLLVITVMFYLFKEQFVVRWALMIVYVLLMAFRERYRLKIYFPEIHFFRKAHK